MWCLYVLLVCCMCNLCPRVDGHWYPYFSSPVDSYHWPVNQPVCVKTSLLALTGHLRVSDDTIWSVHAIQICSSVRAYPFEELSGSWAVVACSHSDGLRRMLGLCPFFFYFLSVILFSFAFEFDSQIKLI